MGLKVKNFSSEGGGDSDLGFKDLENNPNFNKDPEEGKAEAEAAAKLAEEAANKDNDGEPSGEPNNDKGEPSGAPSGEPSGEPESSLKDKDPEGDKSKEVSNEDYFKNLSEKLGREVSSFDDLNQKTENPLDKDPYLKSLSEWREKTGRPLEDWIKFQKDYSKMEDIDVAREILQVRYPELDESGIELELEQYIAVEEDLDREQAMKTHQLKKLAIEGRRELGELKSALDLPDTSVLTPEIQSQLKFVEEIKADVKVSTENQKFYDTKISETSSALETIELNLGEDLKLDFKVSEEDKKGMPDMIATMPRWRNEDGSWNHKAVVEDGVKLKNFDKMLQLAYEQGVNSGTDNVIKDAKNSTLGNQDNKGSQQGNRQKGDIIEGGIDQLLEKKTLKFRKF
tara:strand:+ start:7995 stop:9188 length:1194 start_codon:yes stop_codon:yes gene_type:complete